jgi:hypothetical protein
MQKPTPSFSYLGSRQTVRVHNSEAYLSKSELTDASSAIVESSHDDSDDESVDGENQIIVQLAQDNQRIDACVAHREKDGR